MADGETSNPLLGLDLDFGLSATCPPTPIFEFTDDQQATEATTSLETTLGIGKIEKETSMDYYTFRDNAKADGKIATDGCASHGLSDLSLLTTYSRVDQTIWISIDEESFFHQDDQISLSKVTSQFVASDKKVPDFAYQLPTPPATTSGRETLLDAREVVDLVMEPSASSATTGHASAQGEFIVSDFSICLENNVQHYSDDSVGLDRYYDEWFSN
ncbi:uncharacterized protein CC84DRAFT_1223037 [Paraphaeosphaeria sporulosa]|uniref:Uncharacterized protein n=1 Tax=Paraphaeosphaeria sporulosa TaxID=1460663 RepID=A0A177BXE0_9PLEO|nr:uncharacterized protein CC84DRAFT_1223037 [Paraphaeosphaeria sporulosa]OAF99358.1 hypothetical protein CC84DRAFT_1223037 [Paraphaeosphaeria sporulosa]